MNFLELMQQRYTTKRYNPNEKIDVEKIEMNGNTISIQWNDQSKQMIQQICQNKVELKDSYEIEPSQNLQGELKFYELAKDRHLTNEK